jgi:CDP-diacylglycerol--glycerol-3-phosphate 3-phosphatidyltransferase
MNIPNSISIIRIILVVPLIYLLYQPNINYQWWALSIFIIAAVTDWLDGYLARKLNQITAFGKFLDPLTDKILVIAPLLVLIERQQIPAWAVLLIIVREIVIAGWRINPELNKQKEISGANIWGKLKTVTQIIAITCLIIPLPSFEQFGLISFWCAVILTLISGLIYLLPNTSATD